MQSGQPGLRPERERGTEGAESTDGAEVGQETSDTGNDSLDTGDGDGDVYESLAIFSDKGWETAPDFVATRNSGGLTWGATQILGQWEPLTPDAKACTCDAIDAIDPQLAECCEAEVVTMDFELGQGNIVSPPGVGSVHIAGAPYKFYAEQAQAGASCDAASEISWALLLDN